jgi:hypothetical protein
MGDNLHALAVAVLALLDVVGILGTSPAALLAYHLLADLKLYAKKEKKRRKYWKVSKQSHLFLSFCLCS